jgi:hypothetical protein
MSDNSKSARGPGAPKGRRPVVWVCEAIVGCTCGNAKLRSEKYILADKAPNSEASGVFPQEDAEKAFTEQFNIAPQKIWGPMYDKKGGQQNKSKKRSSVSRDFDGMKLSTEECRAAIYNGWNGLVFDIENQEGKAMFVFTSEINPEPGKKRAAPGAAKISLSELQFAE